MEVEDEIPDGFIGGPKERGGRKKKVPLWLVPLQLGGYAVAVVLFLAMAGATRTAVDTRVAYDTAPVCTVGGDALCGPNDATRETITVTGSTVITDNKGAPEGVVLDFTDPSGQLPPDASASFAEDDTPSLDSASGAGQKFAAELWQGQLMWVADVGDSDGDRYYTDQSVEHTTRFTLVAPAVIGGIDFVCCCFGWWLLVRRGWASDHGSFRPLYALACVIVIGSGWELIARMEISGITVMGVGLLMSALLGLPLPAGLSPARWPGHVRSLSRSLRARRGRTRKEPGRNEIFR